MKKPNPVVVALLYLLIAIAVLWAIYPVWFMALASVRPGQRLLTLDLLGMFVPREVTWSNFNQLLLEEDFLTWLKNSFFVAGLTTILCLTLATSGAFAFSRFRFTGREAILILFLAINAFPGVLALVPITQILRSIGLFGKLAGLIFAYSAGTLVFTTWNLKGYFDTIPIDLEEAAMIDGAGPIQAFVQIALPLARPALAVTALFGFLSGWNEYIMAQVMLPGKEEKWTLPVGLVSLADDRTVPWGLFAAGALLISVPTLIVFLSAQQYLESGLTMGGVKG